LDGGWWRMSDMIPVLKNDVQRREAILVTALQDYFRAQQLYIQNLENLLNIQTKEVERKDAKKKPSVQQ
jgi:hypothetical protein